MKYSVKLSTIISIALICLFIMAAGCTEKAGERIPKVVPYLDNVPSDIDGEGTALLEPPPGRSRLIQQEISG